MKTFKRIIICALCWTTIVGLAIYETNSILQKEYERQSEIATEAHEKVKFNLDMIKIAVMTEDVDTYETNLTETREQMDIISPLGLIASGQADYLNSLDEYAKLLEDKINLLNEIKTAKTNISLLKDKINENYGNKDNLTRDLLKQAKDTILGIKLSASDYTEEKVLAIVNKVNDTLDGISEKASALADCIDTCYKNRISAINDELAEKMKAFAETVESLNADLEKEYCFDKMDYFKE